VICTACKQDLPAERYADQITMWMEKVFEYCTNQRSELPPEDEVGAQKSKW